MVVRCCTLPDNPSLKTIIIHLDLLDYTCPKKHFRIKLSLSEYKEMVGFVNECRLKKHWEVPFVFFKLVLDDAFQYVAIRSVYSIFSVAFFVKTH